MTLQVGDSIPLTLKLWDGDTSKFVKAVVVDSDGTNLGTITLTHVSEGFYQDDSILMPNKEYVTAYYIVYDDPGFATRSVNHQDTADVFALTQLPTEIVKKVDDIIVTVEQQASQTYEVIVEEPPETDIEVIVPDTNSINVDAEEEIDVSVTPEQTIEVNVED